MNETNEMVVRVAKALAKARGSDWNEIGEADRELYCGDARAAIGAMHAAPYEVLDAGVCYEVSAFREEPGQAYVALDRAHVSGQDILGLWGTMIDAALSSNGKGE